MATVESLWWGGVVVGVHSHFHGQPIICVEVVLWLCCVVVGVVTKREKKLNIKIKHCFYFFKLNKKMIK